jgi:hypothetical protein
VLRCLASMKPRVQTPVPLKKRERERDHETLKPQMSPDLSTNRMPQVYTNFVLFTKLLKKTV